MGMVRGGGYLALPLGAPSRGAVGPRPTEGLPDFGLLPIGKIEGDVKKTPVIPPKGTRRQINESWYAAVARPVTDVTGRGNPFLLETAVCFTYSVRGCGLPRRFAPRNDNLFILGSVFFTLLVSLLWRPLRHFVPLSRCGVSRLRGLRTPDYRH